MMQNIADQWTPGPSLSPIAAHSSRLLQFIVFISVFIWIIGFLGGLGVSPKIIDPETGANDTGRIFNWHPLLMTLAFVVCMGEALLAYRCPLIRLPERQTKKAYHFILHTAAMIFGALGLTAAITSHTRKRPDPMANFYSTHSFLGLFTSALFLIQYYLGLTAYLWPKWTLAKRQSLGPIHAFIGLSTFSLGLATMAIGIQEKTTFVQMVSKPGVTSAVMWIPGVIQIFLALYAISIMFLFFNPFSKTFLGHGNTLPPVVIENEPLYFDQQLRS